MTSANGWRHDLEREKVSMQLMDRKTKLKLQYVGGCFLNISTCQTINGVSSSIRDHVNGTGHISSV